MEPRWRRLRGRTGRRSRVATSPRRGSIRSAGGCSSTDRGSSTSRNTSNSTDGVLKGDDDGGARREGHRELDVQEGGARPEDRVPLLPGGEPRGRQHPLSEARPGRGLRVLELLEVELERNALPLHAVELRRQPAPLEDAKTSAGARAQLK